MMRIELSPGTLQASGRSGSADADQGVVWGHDALAGSPHYPWYDERSDGLRPVELREEPDDRSSYSGPHSLGPLHFLLQGLAWTLIAVALAAFAVQLIRYWLRLRREPKQASAARPAAVPVGHGDLLPAAADRGKGDLLEQARRAYEAGDLGQAIVCLFSYQLLRLDQQQIIRLARGKTNRQYLRETRSRPPLQEILGESMILFEEVFFGKHALDRIRFESCWTQLPRFEALCAEAAV